MSRRFSFWIANAILLSAFSNVVEAADCNGNATDDLVEIEAGTSDDCNNNRIPDECEALAVRFAGRVDSAGQPVPSFVRHSALGDVNGDGHLDVVTGSDRSEGVSFVSLVFGTGGGRTREAISTEAGTQLRQIMLVDIDADGDLDVASANVDALLILPNEGDGSLGTPQSIPLASGADSLASGDLNKDGDPDIVAASSSGSSLAVLNNTGGGDLSEPQVFAAGEAPSGVAVADLNGDGNLDLATPTSGTNSVSLLFGNGRGDFEPPLSIPAGGQQPRSLVATDLDGDRDIDLAVATFAHVSILTNDGGSFATETSLGGPSTTFTVSDLNGDGRPDVGIVPRSSRQFQLFVARGQKSYELEQEVLLVWPPRTVVVGDLDADSDLDLAFTTPNPSGTFFLFNEPEGAPAFDSSVTFIGDKPHTISMGDLDGDGFLDAMTGNGDDLTAAVLLNQQDGTLAQAVIYNPAVYILSIQAVDIDLDGDLDMYMGYDRVGTMENQGDGTFAGQQAFAVNGAVAVHAGDVTGDGYPELLSSNPAGDTVTILFNPGDGTFDFKERSELPVGTSPLGLFTADFEGDGDNDLVVCNRVSSTLTLYYNAGDGSFPRREDRPVSGRPRYPRVVDLNGDGHADIVSANGNSTADRGLAVTPPSSVAVLLGLGEGTFADPVGYDTGQDPFSLRAGDMNNDGVLDIVTSNQIPCSISVLFGEGDASFRWVSHTLVGRNPRFAGLGDLDLDGDLDIVAINHTASNAHVLLNRQAAPFDGDFLDRICLPLDFHRVAAPMRTGETVTRVTRFLTPTSDDGSLLSTLFQNVHRFTQQRDFLANVFPEQFGKLTNDQYAALVGRRATRVYYGGAVRQLRGLDGVAYGFSVFTDSATPEQLLSAEETRQVYDALRESFTLAPLVYAPDTSDAQARAREWMEPGFPVVLDGEPPTPEPPPPPAPAPVFTLEIPPGLEICATFGVAGEARGPREEYELKSIARLRSGTIELPTTESEFTAELFDTVRFGSSQETLTALGPGVFRVTQLPGGEGVIVYRFTYEQEYVLEDGRSFVIRVASPVAFRGRDGEALDPPRRFEEADFVALVGRETIQATLAGVPLVRYGSCTYQELDEIEVEVELADGGTLHLRERFEATESLLDTAPAGLVRAEVNLGGAQHVITDYWRLVYSASRHNTRVKYWILLEPPVRVEGLAGLVNGVELEAPEAKILPVARASYLGEDLQPLAEVGVTAFRRTTPSAAGAFRRGDVTGDGRLNLLDTIQLVEHLFRRGTIPCQKSADANDDGAVDLIDALAILHTLFGAGGPLAPPSTECGNDPTADALTCAGSVDCR